MVKLHKNIFFGVVALLLTTGVTATANSLPDCSEDSASCSTIGGCVSPALNGCVGPVSGDDGTTYFGEWKNGQINGLGAKIAPHASWAGQFKGNELNGLGFVYYGTTTQAVDIGNFKDGLLNGYGIRYGADGTIENEGIWDYGEFKYPMKRDQLVTSLTDCSPTGNYHNCFGFQLYESGNSYSGEFQNGKRHGAGVYFYPSGRRYIGYWDNHDQKSGIYIWDTGQVYIGSYVDHKRTGKGVYIHEDRRVYVGDYLNSNKHGKGIIIDPRGGIKNRGWWEAGAFRSGEPIIALNDGNNQNDADLATTGSNLEASTVSISSDQRKLALVIGNAEYLNGPLENPVNDARLIGTTLKSLGFEVYIQENADQKTMKRAIRDFGGKLESAGEDAVGFFYFSGHGLQSEGENYLSPIGAEVRSEADVEIEMVSANAILKQMEFARNGLNIVVLDACRTSPYSRGFRSAQNGLATMDAPTGSILAYATAPGTVAYDGRGDNSPYAGALAKAMLMPNTPVETVFKKVRISVINETDEKQVPWESSSLIGEFMFNAE